MLDKMAERIVKIDKLARLIPSLRKLDTTQRKVMHMNILNNFFPLLALHMH